MGLSVIAEWMLANGIERCKGDNAIVGGLTKNLSSRGSCAAQQYHLQQSITIITPLSTIGSLALMHDSSRDNAIVISS